MKRVCKQISVKCQNCGIIVVANKANKKYCTDCIYKRYLMGKRKYDARKRDKKKSMKNAQLI